MRLKNIPHAKDFLAEHGNLIYMDTEEVPTIAAGELPITVEIGAGRGDFILSHAKTDKTKQFYAIEMYDSVMYRAVDKHLSDPQENLQFIIGDAKNIEHVFKPHSIERIFLNFSDPWPKKRHAKRRLTYRDKLKKYERILIKNGYIEMKTDNRGLFESTLLELSLEGWRLAEISLNIYDDEDFVAERVHQTEYEKRFISKGMPIYFLRAFPGREESEVY